MDAWNDELKTAQIKVPEGQEIENIKKLMREPRIIFVELPVRISIAQ